MRSSPVLLLLALLAWPAHAALDLPPAPMQVVSQTLEDFRWTNRVVVVFADSERDPAFIRQLELLASRPEALAAMDVVVLTDTDPAARTAVRQALRPRGFALVIVDKDGKVLIRKPNPWDVREISRTIQKTPQYREEQREELNAHRELLDLPPE